MELAAGGGGGVEGGGGGADGTPDIVEESVADGWGPGWGPAGLGIEGGAELAGFAGGTPVISADFVTEALISDSAFSIILGICGAGGTMCSGTVGGGWDGLISFDGPSITDFLDKSPTAMSDLSEGSSSGPWDRVRGIDP